MDPQAPHGPGEKAAISLIRQYIAATDATARATLLALLADLLRLGEHGVARGRIEMWLLGLAPGELSNTPDCAAYSELLPQALAGTLPPSSVVYAEFREFLARWDALDEEYEDLQEVLERGYEGWFSGGVPAHASANASLLAQPDAAPADLVWAAHIDAVLDISTTAAATSLRFRFAVQV